MTNHPRYSQPQEPGQHSGAPGYPGGRPDPYQQQPYDWRYARQPQQPQLPPQPQPHQPPQQTQAYRGAYDPYRSSPHMPIAPQPVVVSKKRSKLALASGALAVAVVSAGIGGGVATLVHDDRPSFGTGLNGAAPSIPAAALPAGSVEQVAAKVVPSVVKLETDLGRASEEGSGIILTANGLILTNNHVVEGAKQGPGVPGGARTKVTFSDGTTKPFTVVGTDPSSDIAVVRAQDGAFGFPGGHEAGERIVAVALEIEIPEAFAAADREAEVEAAGRVMGRAVPAGEPMHLFHQARMDGIIVVEPCGDAQAAGRFAPPDFRQDGVVVEAGAIDRLEKGMGGGQGGQAVAEFRWSGLVQKHQPQEMRTGLTRDGGEADPLEQVEPPGQPAGVEARPFRLPPRRQVELQRHVEAGQNEMPEGVHADGIMPARVWPGKRFGRALATRAN